MKITDFKKHDIKYFAPIEITNTNAKIEDVQVALILKYDSFRKIINRRVMLLKNGLTTGGHKSPEHPNGMAGDCTLFPEDGKINIEKIFNAALTAGFTGIGIYYNKESALYSFHLDIGPRYRSWVGIKNKYKESWKYFDLVQDPKLLLLNL